MVRGRSLTFPGVVGQNGAGPHLLPLHRLTRAGLGAGGPRRPVAEHAVSGARHVASHGLWGRERRAEGAVHRLTWRNNTSKLYLIRKLVKPEFLHYFSILNILVCGRLDPLHVTVYVLGVPNSVFLDCSNPRDAEPHVVSDTEPS